MSSSRNRGAATRIAVVVVSAWGLALAHHSLAQFDARQSHVIEGAVTGFEWSSPHVRIVVDAASVDGRAVAGSEQWTLVAESPAVLARDGVMLRAGRYGSRMTGAWNPLVLHLGDKVSVHGVAAMYDGARVASFHYVVLPSGDVLAVSARLAPGAPAYIK